MNKLLQTLGTLGALLVWWVYPIGWLLIGVVVFALGTAVGFLVSGAL